MNSQYEEAFSKLRQNPSEVFDEALRLLCKIGDNILRNPLNTKLRTLQKTNATVSNKILSVKGGKECLRAMGFEEKDASFIMDARVPLDRIDEFVKLAESCSKRKTLTGTVKVINDDRHFQFELTNALGRLVVADFTATWCGPCKYIAPIFENLAAKYPRAVFLKVDVDKCKPTAAAQGVTAMPTFIFYRKGNKLDIIQGANAVGLENKIMQYYGVEDEEDKKNQTSQMPSTSKKNSNTNNNNNEKDDNIIRKTNLPPLKLTYSNPFLSKIEVYAHGVLQYEDKDLQKRTKDLIPVASLEENAQKRLRVVQTHIKKSKQDKLKDPELSIQDMLILELLQWFKEDFFSWVDSPPCQFCGQATVFSHMSTDPKDLKYTDRVEMHKCKNCQKETPFPRYNDLNILLETRKGRCGEWANTFTLCCRAMGWDARFVVDEGDHVWTEVYSVAQRRWLHCDPCENLCDTPLVYESGWKKKISYIIAYSAEEVQDVTWRYSSYREEVLKRRTLCSETELLGAIFKIRADLQKNLSPARKTYLIKRCLSELVEFLTEKKVKEGELQGRTSGSEAWRLIRGETHESAEQSKHVWKINSENIIGNTVTIRYSSSLNKYEYISGNKTIQEIKGWEAGTSEFNGVFRKVEKDWKMVYLTRTEGAETGSISWKFDLSNCKRALDTIVVQVNQQTYENGVVRLKMCSDETCVILPKSDLFTTKDFNGSNELTMTATLSGGIGETSWQHAQLFRQSLDSSDFNFNVTFTFQ